MKATFASQLPNPNRRPRFGFGKRHGFFGRWIRSRHRFPAAADND